MRFIKPNNKELYVKLITQDFIDLSNICITDIYVDVRILIEVYLLLQSKYNYNRLNTIKTKLNIKY